jgi:hypothetical protein
MEYINLVQMEEMLEMYAFIHTNAATLHEDATLLQEEYGTFMCMSS